MPWILVNVGTMGFFLYIFNKTIQNVILPGDNFFNFDWWNIDLFITILLSLYVDTTNCNLSFFLQILKNIPMNEVPAWLLNSIKKTC